MIYALDSNIISYLLKKDQQIIDKYNEENANGNSFIIPPVVYYEINRGLTAIGATAKIQRFNYLCSELGVGDMDIRIWTEAVKIYVGLIKRGNLIEDADIFIAAYCIINNYTLVTNNLEHFARINNLNYTNWK